MRSLKDIDRSLENSHLRSVEQLFQLILVCLSRVQLLVHFMYGLIFPLQKIAESFDLLMVALLSSTRGQESEQVDKVEHIIVHLP